MLRLYDELKRRNVFRVAAAYLAAAWLVVQLLEALLPIFGLDETAGQPIVVFLALGFVPALVLSWFFEFTVQGLRSQTDLDLEQGKVPRPHGSLDTVIIVTLVLAVGYFAVDKFILDPARDERLVQTAVEDALAAPIDRSIAVLPFVDMSPNQDQEYFSDGLSEELLNLLAKIPDLSVASRTSSFAFKNQNVQIQEVAEALTVGHVLEGSVRMSGDRVRVTAQLIKADDGYHLWSETFERTLDDIFAVQDEIAAMVVEALEVTLVDPPPKTQVTDGEAYSMYLQAIHLTQQFTPDSMQKARDVLEQVLEIDPDYVPALDALSSALTNLAMNGAMDPQEAMDQAKAASERSIELDPEFGGGYAQLGWIAHAFEGDLAASARYFQRALELEPGEEGIIGNAAVLAEALGNMALAIPMKQYLATKAPTNAIAHNNLGLAYFYDRQFEKAADSMRTAILLSPNYIGANYRLGMSLLYLGETEAAIAAFEQEPDDEYREKGMLLAANQPARWDEADPAVVAFEEKWAEQYPVEVAHVYAYRGNKDKAFEYLEIRKERQSYSAGSFGEQRLNPLFDNLRDDPRWEEFLTAVGVSDEQLSQISFTATLPELTE